MGEEVPFVIKSSRRGEIEVIEEEKIVSTDRSGTVMSYWSTDSVKCVSFILDTNYLIFDRRQEAIAT